MPRPRPRSRPTGAGELSAGGLLISLLLATGPVAAQPAIGTVGMTGRATGLHFR